MKNSHQSLTFFMDIDAAVLPMVDFVMSYDWIACCTDLNASESVAINIVMLDQSSTFAKYVNTTLMTVVNLIFTYGWIGVRRDPNASKVIAVNSIFDELS